MSNLRYPLRKLDSVEDYLQIDVLDYEPPGLGSKNNNSLALRSSDDTYKDLLNGSDSIQKIICSIILPIPEGIGDSMTVNWGAGEINPLQAALLPIAQSTISGGLKKGFDELVSQGSKVASIIQTATGQKATQSTFAAAAVNALVGGGNINQAISRVTGAVFNPNIELLFSGIQLRGAFTFSFDMIPRFQKESEEVKRIIRIFKSAMAPRRRAGGSGPASGVFIQSPNVFRLRYMNGGRIHPYLNRFKICALNGMNIDYTGSGTYSTYSDSTPVHMRMNLVFQELTPIFHEDYYEGQGKGGTGY